MSTRKRKLSLSESSSENLQTRRFFDVIVDHISSTQGTRRGTGTLTMVALEKLAQAMGLTGVWIRCVHSRSGQGLIAKLVREYKWVSNGPISAPNQPSEKVFFYRGPRNDRVPIIVPSQRAVSEILTEEATYTKEEAVDATTIQNAGVHRCKSLQDVALWMAKVMTGQEPNTATTFLIANDCKLTLKLSRAPRMKYSDFQSSGSFDQASDVVSPY